MSGYIELPLAGCAPVPLAHYLKALGVLRLVSEQRDPHAAGFWKNDTFHLVSTLDRDLLVDFFLKDYRPTPIIVPWNGGSGFYFQETKLAQKDPVTGRKIKTGERTQPTAATIVVDTILSSSNERFAEYQKAIRIAKEWLRKLGFIEAPESPAKDELISILRAQLPDAAVRWMDAVCVLVAGDEPGAPLGAAFELLWGLALLDWQAVKPDDLPDAPSEPQIAPSAFYALLKLCFTRPVPDEEPVPLMPAIHRRAARGDGAFASGLAARRLRASGFAPAVEKIPVAGQLARRTAAALLFPITRAQIELLGTFILRPKLLSAV